MRVSQFATIAALGTLAAASSAMASTTVATFADPSNNSNNPLFTFNGTTLTGQWLGPASGLLLETPGVAAPDYANAQFQMTPLTVSSNFGGIYFMNGGSINFSDSFGAPLLTISFTSALLSGALGLGASDFTGFAVTFSGPILNGYTVSNESFSFSFANPITSGNGFSVTSSFTSSADLVVPTPGAAALLGLGGMFASRRRR
jgi:MYXO-CTERM domain-containing protein